MPGRGRPALQVVDLDRDVRAAGALRTSSVARAVSVVSPTAVFFVPSGLTVENTARKPESPVMENRKNPSSSGWLM